MFYTLCVCVCACVCVMLWAMLPEIKAMMMMMMISLVRLLFWPPTDLPLTYPCIASNCLLFLRLLLACCMDDWPPKQYVQGDTSPIMLSFPQLEFPATPVIRSNLKTSGRSADKVRSIHVVDTRVWFQKWFRPWADTPAKNPTVYWKPNAL